MVLGILITSSTPTGEAALHRPALSLAIEKASILGLVEALLSDGLDTPKGKHSSALIVPEQPQTTSAMRIGWKQPGRNEAI